MGSTWETTLAGEDSEAGDDKCVESAITEDCETKATYKLIEAFSKDEKQFDKFDECLTKSLGLTSDDVAAITKACDKTKECDSKAIEQLVEAAVKDKDLDVTMADVKSMCTIPVCKEAMQTFLKVADLCLKPVLEGCGCTVAGGGSLVAGV